MSDLNIQVIDYQSAEAPVEFTRSLKETGFAAIQNHPIDMDLVNDVYQEWENLFQSDYKHQYKFHPEKQDGYFPFGIEHAKDYSQKDLLELFEKDAFKDTSTVLELGPQDLVINNESLETHCTKYNLKSEFNELIRPFVPSLKPRKRNILLKALKIIYYSKSTFVKSCPSTNISHKTN